MHLYLVRDEKTTLDVDASQGAFELLGIYGSAGAVET